MSEQRNLIVAIVLSVAVLFGWQYFVGVPQMEQELAQQQTESAQAPAPAVQPGAAPAPAVLPRAQALAAGGARAAIDTPLLDGSVNLTGARIDDLRLRTYRETTDPESAEIELLNPDRAEHPFFAEFGWIAAPGGSGMPDGATVWTQTGGDTLAPGKDITLRYDNGQGLVFTRRIAVDERYMFTVVDRVENQGGAPAVLYPYALVTRHNIPDVQHFWVVHEGFIGVGDGTLKDESYDDLGEDNSSITFTSTGGWVGITDKYWMAAVIPPQQEAFTGTYKAYDRGASTGYQSDYLLEARSIAPGAAQEVTHHLFAGAKVVEIVEDYQTALGIDRFDLAVDWGWFFFLTRPIFLALDFLFEIVGNFGVAILIFTVFVKLLFFPLANTSYRAMSKMKKLQPEMERLRERHKDDRMAQQQALMELYRTEKVNPLAGCLPVIVQIPVFFSLYKVLFVTIEMRHAPFFGWINDLAAPESISLFNLFGLLPFTPPGFLMIGVFALLMGLTMWIQTNLNPPPADPVQARIFAFMPIIFTFMLAGFPVGLIIYWTWNNVLSILQQVYIMKRTGTPVDLFDRMRPPWGRRAREAGPPA